MKFECLTENDHTGIAYKDCLQGGLWSQDLVQDDCMKQEFILLKDSVKPNNNSKVNY